MTITERVAEVRARVALACERSRRDPSDVTLVAVSKTFPADVVMQGIEAGLTDLGENRAQDLKQKAAVLGDRVRWHFIGHLQSNKVSHVVGVAHLIHSVDRLGLAEAVARRAMRLGITQQVLIEVNVSGEATKAGIAPSTVGAFVTRVAALEGLDVKGLMTMPPRTDDPMASKPYFEELALLREEALAAAPGARHLSMGMTQDFEVAIASGATLVRVGEAIFGPRR